MNYWKLYFSVTAAILTAYFAKNVFEYYVLQETMQEISTTYGMQFDKFGMPKNIFQANNSGSRSKKQTACNVFIKPRSMDVCMKDYGPEINVQVQRCTTGYTQDVPCP